MYEINDRIPTQSELSSLKTIFDDIPIIGFTYDLSAIWLTQSIITGNGKTRRLVSGMKVRIEDKILVDISENNPSTHVILKVKGMIYSHFVIFAQRILDGSLDMIKL